MVNIKQEYVFFDCQENDSLFEAIKTRLQQIGYIHSFGDSKNNIAISNIGIYTFACGNLKYARNNKDVFLEGDLNTLFYTNDYKFIPPVPPIKIGDYNVRFEDNGIRVGCQFVSKAEILEIASHYK